MWRIRGLVYLKHSYLAFGGRLHVRRPNREFLLRIRRGEFGYEELVTQAEALVTRVEAAFATSALPEAPDKEAAEQLLIRTRRAWYGQ